MKPNRIPLYLFLSLGMLLLLTACKKEPVTAAPEKASQQATTPSKDSTDKDNTYSPMRYMALHVKANDLGLHFSLDKTVVYGMVMDWNMGKQTATTVAFQTGDASMYFSTGGAVIGGRAHETVSDAAKLWVVVGQQYLTEAEKTEETPLPETDGVNFYFITNRGIYVAHEQMANIESKGSYWLHLFDQANVVITELRKTTQQH